jgi:nicotinamidase/pyrazinamidase
MSRITITHESDVLGLIDVQPTFMPGGELPVPEGHAVLRVIARLLGGPFRHAFATQDWHPPGHISFASTHGAEPFSEIDLHYGRQTLWPDHGVQGSPNAAIHPDIDQSRIQAIIRKGFHPHTDSYSAFFENDRTTPTGLDGWLRTRGFRRLFMTGLATDFCVGWSAEDAAALGYETYIIEDACRGVGLPGPGNRSTMEVAWERLQARGVRFVTSADLA